MIAPDVLLAAACVSLLVAVTILTLMLRGFDGKR